jgi:hypothetical protein
MTKPVRLQLSRQKGFCLAEHSHATNGLQVVNVARPGVCGNPFPVDVYGAKRAVDLFRRWIAGNMSTREMAGLSRVDRWSEPDGVSLVTLRAMILDCVPQLQGVNLACWCQVGAPCHADVLLEIANPKPTQVRA